MHMLNVTGQTVFQSDYTRVLEFPLLCIPVYTWYLKQKLLLAHPFPLNLSILVHTSIWEFPGHQNPLGPHSK